MKNETEKLNIEVKEKDDKRLAYGTYKEICVRLDILESLGEKHGNIQLSSKISKSKSLIRSMIYDIMQEIFEIEDHEVAQENIARTKEIFKNIRNIASLLNDQYLYSLCEEKVNRLTTLIDSDTKIIY